MLYVIIGPPTSGKTTLVNQRARSGDIVIDYDRIAQAFTAPVDHDEHTHTTCVAQVARIARRVAIDKALTLTDRIDVYLIHATPSAADLTRYRQHRAQIITVDPGRAIVEQRARHTRPAHMQDVINQWYENHSSTT